MHRFSGRDSGILDPVAREVLRGDPTSIDIGELFRDATGSATNHRISLPGCRRSEWVSETEANVIVDSFDCGAECMFVRMAVAGRHQRRFSFGAGYRFTQCASGGWLLLPEDDGDFYWIPQLPLSRQLDAHARILAEQPARIAELSLDRTGFAAAFVPAVGANLDLVVWRFSRQAQPFITELNDLLPSESQAIFLWGSHARIDRPSDLFRHVIHGAIYDVRFAWPHNRKCFSENEAHSLYVALAGLGNATGKRLYRALQQQLVMCVLARQAPDGGWYHGLWTESMECHYRLHASGVHLLLDEFERQPSEPIRAGLERAVGFLAQQTDRIDAGAWLLHDSLEKSRTTLEQGPFKWVESTALGKSATNMLVLNTHLDSTIAIGRYAAATGDAKHDELVRSARKATDRVLALRTADWLYRPLFAAIGLTMLPTATARQLSASKRAVKRIAWRYLTARLPAIKSRWPRLRMPNGYIDRELSLRTWAFDYHSINIMDLLRHHRRFGDRPSLDAALDGIGFAQKISLPERLTEVEGKQYALGFWAESLYHWCTLCNDFKAREALAMAMIQLVDLGLGLPPSLLGGNGEVVAHRDQIPCPIASDPRLRVCNLCYADAREILVVNPTAEPIEPTWLRGRDWLADLAWKGPGAKPVPANELNVPARGFLSGTTKKT